MQRPLMKLDYHGVINIINYDNYTLNKGRLIQYTKLYKDNRGILDVKKI